MSTRFVLNDCHFLTDIPFFLMQSVGRGLLGRHGHNVVARVALDCQRENEHVPTQPHHHLVVFVLAIL